LSGDLSLIQFRCLPLLFLLRKLLADFFFFYANKAQSGASNLSSQKWMEMNGRNSIEKVVCALAIEMEFPINFDVDAVNINSSRNDLWDLLVLSETISRYLPLSAALRWRKRHRQILFLIF
jgi:hypothetical protein